MAGLLDTQVNYAPFGENSIFAQDMAREQMQRAQVNNDINQQGSLQDLFHNEQMNPLKVQGKSLENQGLEAGLPGIFAESEGKQIETRKKKATADSDIETYLSNNYAKMSENDAKQLSAYGLKLGQMAAAVESSGQFLPAMYDTSPEVQQMLATPDGRKKLMDMAEKMQKFSGDHLNKMAEIKQMGENRVSLEELRGKNSARVAQIRAESQAASDKIKASKSAQEANMNIEQAITYFGRRAAAETDPDLRATYEEEANRYATLKQQLELSRGGAPQVGKPTLVPGQGDAPAKLGTTPAPAPVQPFNGKKLAPADQEAVDWAQANSNDPRAAEILKRNGIQ